jgi:hypothetical protein
MWPFKKKRYALIKVEGGEGAVIRQIVTMGGIDYAVMEDCDKPKYGEFYHYMTEEWRS